MAELPGALALSKRTKRTLALALAVLGLAAFPCLPALAQQRYPGEHWEKASTREALGWSSEKLQRAREYSETIDTAAVMIIFDGVILEEWGETRRRFKCHSIRKSFLSALYGIYVQEGQIDLSRTLEQLGIDDNHLLTPVEKQARVADLLKARSGVYHPALYETPRMKAARPPRGSHRPGTFWYYNNWDFNALGTIFEQETDAKIFEAFERRIADPLEMEDFRVEDGYYFRGPASIHPAYPFRMTARDMARFGLLYLRRGNWRGQQIVPAEWVAESTTAYSKAGRAGGYGYMWWVEVKGRHLPGVSLPEGTYSARGAGGHYLLVIPSEKLVIVHRVNTDVRGQRVTAEQFGRLVRLIREAKTTSR